MIQAGHEQSPWPVLGACVRLTAQTFVMLVCVLTIATSCAKPVLRPVPHPDVATYTPAVRAHIQSAIAALDAASADHSALANAYGQLGNAYLSIDARDAAEASYRNAIALHPDEFRWHYFLGYLYDRDAQPQAALGHYAQATALKPDYLPGQLRAALAAYATGDEDQALMQLRAVVSKDPQQAIAHEALGRHALREGQHAQAIEHLRRALELVPEANTLHLPLAKAYRLAGDRERAREQIALRGEQPLVLADPLLDAMRDAQPKTPRELMDAANKAAADGRFDDGLALYERAVAADPGHLEAREALGRAYFFLERPGDAQMQLEAAVAIEPQTPIANFFLGALRERAGEQQLAIAHYEAAIAGGESTLARESLATVLMRQGEFDRAAEQYAYLAQQSLDDHRRPYWHGMALLAAGRCEDAIVPLTTANQLSPGSALVIEALARVEATCAALDAAARAAALERARLLFGSRSTSSYAITMAMALAANGLFDDAIKLQTEVVRRARKSGALPDLAAQEQSLALYREKRPATLAWPLGHPRFVPASQPPESAPR